MKRIEIRRRMLRCREIWVTRHRMILDRWRRQAVTNNHHRHVQRDVRRWQYARRLRGNQSLAAVMALVRRVAGHRSAALHAFLVERHRRHAVRELQEQDRDQGQHQQCGSSNHILTLGRLDARVKGSDARQPNGYTWTRDRTRSEKLAGATRLELAASARDRLQAIHLDEKRAFLRSG